MSYRNIPVLEETYQELKKTKLQLALNGEDLTWDDILRRLLEKAKGAGK